MNTDKTVKMLRDMAKAGYTLEDLADLLDEVNRIDRLREDEEEENLDRKIEEILKKLKVLPKLQGFDYIRESVKIMLRGRGNIKFSSELYPILHEIFGVSIDAIEVGIRYATKVSQEKLSDFEKKQYFATTEHLTVREYIELIVLLVKN